LSATQRRKHCSVVSKTLICLPISRWIRARSGAAFNDASGHRLEIANLLQGLGFTYILSEAKYALFGFGFFFLLSWIH
jgi:hypothetical protein